LIEKGESKTRIDMKEIDEVKEELIYFGYA